MNTQLVESLAQIIDTLTEEEQVLLYELRPPLNSEKTNFHETATPAEWIDGLKKWSKTRSLNTVYLSDEAISRESIYGNRG